MVSYSLFQEGRESTVFVSVLHVRDVEKNKRGCMQTIFFISHLQNHLQNLQRLILKIAITACMQYVGPRNFTQAVCFAMSLWCMSHSFRGRARVSPHQGASSDPS